MTYREDDPTILKIKGESSFDGQTDEEKKQQRKTYIKRVSLAILTVISKHGHAKLRSVGAASLSNAVKSSIIAKGEGAKKGLDLVTEMSFDNADFDGSVKTAIMIKIVERNGA